jgi:hypothetical protein
VLLESNNTLYVPDRAPSIPCARTGSSFAEWVLVCRPPLNWFFVKPCSGARRAAGVQQHAQRAGLGASNPLRTNRERCREWIAVALRPNWPGTSWRRGQGLAVLLGSNKRAGSDAPFGMELRVTLWLKNDINPRPVSRKAPLPFQDRRASP